MAKARGGKRAVTAAEQPPSAEAAPAVVGGLSPALDALPRTAQNHFRLRLFAAVARLLRHLSGMVTAEGEAANGTDLAFLAGYAAEMRSAGVGVDDATLLSPAWWREQTALWEAAGGSGARLPLRALVRDLGLGGDAVDLLMLAGLVEEDIRFGSLFALLQEPLPARRPCLGLLGAILTDDGDDEAEPVDPWQVAGSLLRAGLLTVESRTAPRADWLARVPPLLWDALRGAPREELNAGAAASGARLFSRREFPPLKRLTLPPALRGPLCALPAILARGETDALLLRGMAESGRRTLFGSLARTLRQDLLFIDRTKGLEEGDDFWPLVGPLCTLTGALPVFEIDPGPGETVTLPPLAGYAGPVGVALRREGGVTGPRTERTLTLTVPPPTRAEREAIWRAALGDEADKGDLAQIAETFLLPLGSIRRAAPMARACAALASRPGLVTRADVRAACRARGRQALDTLAQRLETGGGGWERLVVEETTAREMGELELRCRCRERVLDYVGPALAGANRGVRALFSGPSGTGKTLAACVLGAVLEMDVYRVDLASVVNKYIGETEKNLSLLLARAEEMDIVLLIDEGDSLMTGRTDVKSANDRYANLETNYLLQRLETYEGIVLVTTNASSRIDQAFLRRFDVTVEFLPPAAAERLGLWERHLPARHAISPAFLRGAAQQCALTGGQIRNAALYTALLAVDAGRGDALSDDDLEAAIFREYRKMGASCPLGRGHHANGRQATLDRFLSEIR